MIGHADHPGRFDHLHGCVPTECLVVLFGLPVIFTVVDVTLLDLASSGENHAPVLSIPNTPDLPVIPRAIVEVPPPGPIGFHGDWVPDLV